MAGIRDKIGSLFGKKAIEPRREEYVRRIEPKPEPTEESDVGSRWRTAQKWREDKALEEPLVKRRDFKRKY